jgi:hypothetical protein
MALRRAYQQPQAGVRGDARNRMVLGTPSLPVLTTDLVTGGQIAAMRAPAGFTVTGINATIPDMDTGATLTISIGDAANNARFVSASTAGQAGGNITTLAAGGAYYQFTADTDVLITFPAGPAGATAGTITNLYLEGFIQFP